MTVMTASLRSVACDVVEYSFCELVCFGSDFDHDGVNVFVRNSCLVDDRTITIMAERSHWISRRGSMSSSRRPSRGRHLGSQRRNSCRDHRSLQRELSTQRLAFLCGCLSVLP